MIRIITAAIIAILTRLLALILTGIVAMIICFDSLEDRDGDGYGR